MKKSLLFLTGVCLSGVLAAQAIEPVVCETASFQGISPNGRYLISEVYGNITIFDLETDKSYFFQAGETGEPYYSAGLGNNISDTGIVLMSTSNETDAAYWEAGEIKQLPTVGVTGVNHLANGVTADGSRICGSLGIHEFSLDDATMLVPVYWDRKADGTYDNYVVLPHPSADFFGRAPQYITANGISNDGKVIVGQMVDCTGMLLTPIVYTQDTEGKWSYDLPAKRFFNPDNIELPAYPGEGPSQPDAENYMTDSKKAEYQAAYQDWISSGYLGDMPEAIDYLSDDAKAEYQEALEKYKAEFAAWNELSDAYYTAFGKVLETSPSFEFNNIYISGDGKYCTTSAMETVEDPMSWMGFSTKYEPWQFVLTDGSLTKYTYDSSIMVTSVSDGGVIFASNGMGSVPVEGYVLRDGTVTPFIDYLGTRDAGLVAWAKENMTHEVEEYDFENNQLVCNKYLFSGMPSASADLSTVVTWTDTPWDYLQVAVGYIFRFGSQGGVNSVATDDSAIRFDADGRLCVGDAVVHVCVYDLSGACVLDVAVPESAVTCNLQKGVYIVRATAADGTVTVVKTVR